MTTAVQGGPQPGGSKPGSTGGCHWSKQMHNMSVPRVQVIPGSCEAGAAREQQGCGEANPDSHRVMHLSSSTAPATPRTSMKLGAWLLNTHVQTVAAPGWPARPGLAWNSQGCAVSCNPVEWHVPQRHSMQPVTAIFCAQ